MKKILIAPLGNPGVKYANTRHNAGRIVVDKVYEKIKDERGFQVFEGSSFMNDSGVEISKFLRYNTESELVLVYDDKDLPIGEVRISNGGGSGGHNGVKSVISHVGEDFVRIRIGIAPIGEDGMTRLIKGEATAGFVLAILSKSDREILTGKVADLVYTALLSIRDKGVQHAQELVNGR